jgi:heme iron utilization protein
MDADRRTAWETLSRLLAAQQLAVLATQRAGQPYTSLVAFVSAGDLRQILFVTERATRKYANVMADSRVAMHIDDRENRIDDIQEAISVTAVGKAIELHGEEKEAGLGVYLAKNSHLREFATSSTAALLRVDVETYFVVSQFQHLVELPVSSAETRPHAP